jgi:hypothetical protein
MKNEKVLEIYNNLTNVERKELFDLMLNKRWDDFGGAISNEYIIETITREEIVNDLLTFNVECITDWVEDNEVSEDIYSFIGLNDGRDEVNIDPERLDLLWDLMELDTEENHHFIMGYNDENMRVWDYIDFYEDRTFDFLDKLQECSEFVSWKRDTRLEGLGL